jgi:hypothetical protein
VKEEGELDEFLERTENLTAELSGLREERTEWKNGSRRYEVTEEDY